MRSSIAHKSARTRNTVLAALLGLALSLGFLVGPPEPAEAATCPCTIFTSTQTPTVANDPDNVPIELGVKFRADQDGLVSHPLLQEQQHWHPHRFTLERYRHPPRNRHLYRRVREGWQQADFGSPVAVTATPPTSRPTTHPMGTTRLTKAISQTQASRTRH